MNEYTITLAQIAGELGTSLDHVANLCGDQVILDWRGHHAVTASVAGQVVKERRRAEAEHEANRAAYEAYLDGRARDRAASVDKAADETWESWLKRKGRPYQTLSLITPGGQQGPRLPAVRDPEAEEAVALARVEAGEKFDRKRPILPYDIWEKKGRVAA